ncbi:universal stress protein [Roseicyclus sp.]|uniref:universal stress protein n=1 Tax=Roseicyclus sp. TaxID=1914329 RepID=UPI003FA13D2A
MKSIMVATDFSERSDRALRRATLLARQSGARLRVVHAIDDDMPERMTEGARGAAAALLETMQATVREVDGVPCETRIVIADPFAGIAQAAREDAPDLLVLGPHRRQALRDIFAGTTAERTIRAVDCPVLMVNGPPVGPWRRIVVATDLGDASARALGTFRRLGLSGDAEVSLLHAYTAPVETSESAAGPVGDWALHLEALREDSAERLRDFAGRTGASGWGHVLRPSVQGTAAEILSAAAEASADLLVVGTQGRSGATRFFLGSVAEAVLRNARCDVLAIPPVGLP